MSNEQKDVAVFIDFENIYVSVREKFDATPNFESLMERCEDYGRVVVARAYADWYRYPRITSALFANNIEPMYVPTYYYDKDEGRTGRPIKNSVDMHMCIDAMRTLYTRTNISTYVFITGDRDFIALVNCVRQEGKDVIIVGIGGAASSHLAQSADEFLFYEQIVDIRPMGHNNRRSHASNRSERSSERSSSALAPSTPDRSGDRNGSSYDRRRDRAPERTFEKERASETPTAPAAQQSPTLPAAQQSPTPPVQPIVASPQVSATPSPLAQDESIYDRLVEALDLARKRGYVSSFGSLKVLMKELMPNFKESRYRDSQGRPFAKFTDFVREAERLGKIQIFTSGTVNEIFLPDEDPYKLSQFAEDLPSVEAERELEEELALEAEARQDPKDRTDRTGRRRRRRGAPRPESTSSLDLSESDEDTNDDETYTFGDQEWGLFYRVMQSYKEPVPFADIFNDLRELRNAEELDLTNNALKELIKQAINEHRLQRSNRGAKAHYRLLDSGEHSGELSAVEHASPLPDLDDENGDDSVLPDIDESVSDDETDAATDTKDVVSVVELPDLDDDEASEIITQQIQATMQPVLLPDIDDDDSETAVTEKAAEEKATEAPAEQATPAAEDEKPKPKRRRRKKPEEKPEEKAAEEKATEAPGEQAAPAAEDEKPKPKRRRRKKPEEKATEAPAEQAAPAAEDEKPKPKRRRRKKPEEKTAADGDES